VIEQEMNEKELQVFGVAWIALNLLCRRQDFILPYGTE
jgi:hypothetical protein